MAKVIEESYSDRDFELWVLLAQTREAMFNSRKKELSKYSITPRESAVLNFVQTLGDRATPAEIARWLLREPHSISELLDRMEKRGLLKKDRDLNRRNVIRVSVTERGLEMHHQSLKRKFIHKIMFSLSDEESQQLRVYLEKLRDSALKQRGMKIKPPFSPKR